MALVMLAAQGNVQPLPSLGISNDRPSRQMWERLTFIGYAALFLSVWLVYFLSRSEMTFFNVRTLRKLLRLTSHLWQPGSHSLEQKEIEVFFADKARTSITILGILTAAAGLELVQVNVILLSASRPKFMADPWEVSMLAGATLAAIAAFGLFLISADSLDALFNRFVHDADGHMLKRHFYRQTITPRYLGKVMLMLGAVLLVAFHKPTLGSVAMGVLICIGYRHWFPNFPDLCAQLQCGTVNRLFRIIQRAVSAGAYLLLLTTPLLTSHLGKVHIPPHVFAALAAALWAFSAPVVNRGLSQLPTKGRFYGILCGLSVSLLSGWATLMLMKLGTPVHSNSSMFLVLAGALTFPLGTGLYYWCSHAFGERAELAAQFIKVKPILSVLLAAVLLGESIRWLSGISLVLVVVGVSFLLSSGQQGKLSIVAVLVGLLTAFSWSLGEIFFKLGNRLDKTFDDTLFALFCGMLLGVVGMLFMTFIVRRVDREAIFEKFSKWAMYFILHGVLSFGLAYACLFRSIAAIGVGRSAMITAFWPIASIITSATFVFDKTVQRPVSWHVIAAAAALLTGSLLQLLT